MTEKKVTPYTGKEAEVYWDERLCIGIGECVRAKGKLFISGRDPWCQPDLATSVEVAEVCQRCPSGSLSYTVKDDHSPETAPPNNTVMVSYNGPLFMHGELEIIGAPEDSPGLRFRAALCRCGASKNKPFCDNSHAQLPFQEAGAIGESGSDQPMHGGKLTIKPLKDGPLMITGHVSLIAGSGRVAWHGDKLALCRCGASKNKPFCDGSHNGINFRSDE